MLGVSIATSSGQPRTRLEVGLLALAAAATVFVHRRELGAFFTSPDDLTHLQQAVGLTPTYATPFRVLSQAFYFRFMVAAAGLDPVPYHVAVLTLHLVNLVLVRMVARRLGVPTPASMLAILFVGTFPIFSSILASAVGINDTLALALTLASFLLLDRSRVWSAACFALALMSKESVLLLPFLLLLRDAGSLRTGIAQLVPHLVILTTGAIAFAVLRPLNLAPDPVTYAAGIGPHVFHNAMTYLSWSVHLWSAIPDLVSSYDPRAWRVGLLVVAAIAAGAWALPDSRRSVKVGLAWWLLGILPVLPLTTQTYRHYLYPALPGMAIAVAGVMTAAAVALDRRASSLRAPVRPFAVRPRPFALVLFVAVASVLYAVRADQIVERRMRARIPGTALAFDPVVRRSEVARLALGTLGSQIGVEDRKIAILEPAGTERVFGARSAREYRAGAPAAYDLLQASLNQGTAVRLFYPHVDSVMFVSRWDRSREDWTLYVAYL